MQLLIFFYTFATKKDTAFELRDFLGKSFVNTFLGFLLQIKTIVVRHHQIFWWSSNENEKVLKSYFFTKSCLNSSPKNALFLHPIILQYLVSEVELGFV